MPEPLKLLSVPPVTAMSLRSKSVLSSLRVKVMVALSPACKAALSLVMAMVGAVVSGLRGLPWSVTVVSNTRPRRLLASTVVAMTPVR